MKKLFRQMNERLVLPADFSEKVFARLEAGPRRVSLRPLGAAAAVLAALCLATPVMAAYAPSLGELIGGGPEAASRFTSIQTACEEQGFRMEAVSAAVEGNRVDIYLTFRDVSGQGRLDEHSDILFRSLLGSRPELEQKRVGDVVMAHGGSVETQYDPDSGTLNVLIRWNGRYADGNGGFQSIREVFGDSLTVTVDEIYRDDILYSGPLALALSGETMEVAVEKTEEDYLVPGGEVTDFFHSYMRRGGQPDPWAGLHSYALIVPGEPMAQWGNLAVTGMAWLEGSLHVQVRAPEGAEAYARFRLENVQGETRHPDREIDFTIPQGARAGRYEEYVFEDLSQADLTQWTLLCDATERMVYGGPWQVTFPTPEDAAR